jgi:hypothetical protein
MPTPRKRHRGPKDHDFVPDAAGLSCQRCSLPARNQRHDKSGTLDRLTNTIRETLTRELTLRIAADEIDRLAGQMAENILTAEPMIWK